MVWSTALSQALSHIQYFGRTDPGILFVAKGRELYLISFGEKMRMTQTVDANS